MKNAMICSGDTPLIKIQERFKRWRESEGRSRKIPDELWKAAVDLYPGYSVSRINSTLNISYSKLKKKIKEKKKGSEIVNNNSFIELKLDSLVSKTVTNETAILEIKSKNGTKLKIYSSENIDFNFICQEFINKLL